MFEEVVVEEELDADQSDHAEAIGDISFDEFLALVPSHRLKPGVVNPWCKAKAAPRRMVLKPFVKPSASAHPKDIKIIKPLKVLEKPFLNARTMPPSVMKRVPTCPQCRLEQKTGPTVSLKVALPTPSRNKHLPPKVDVIKPSQKMNSEGEPEPFHVIKPSMMNFEAEPEPSQKASCNR